MYVIKNLTIVLMTREVIVFKKRIHRPRALATIDDRYGMRKINMGQF